MSSLPARDLPLRLSLKMDEDMLAGRVVPKEERLAVLGAAVEEVERLGDDLVVERLHALDGQRAFVLGRTVGGAGDDAARIEFLAELRIGRAVRIFEILVAVQVIEIAPELVEAVPVRQMLLEVAEMVLAELGGRIARGLEDFGKRDVFLLQARGRAGRADRRQAGADRKLAGEEGGAPRRATRLRVERGQPQALVARDGRCWASGRP